MKFQFGNIVVVDDEEIGVIVKSWFGDNSEDGWINSHDVYVRSYNGVKCYKESEIRHYVYSKELLDEQKEFYH